MQPSTQKLTSGLGGYSFETILATLSVIAYLNLFPYSAVTLGIGILYPQPDNAPGGLFLGLLFDFKRNQSRAGEYTLPSEIAYTVLVSAIKNHC